MHCQTQILLKTKLRQPPVTKGLIARPLLIEQLPESFILVLDDYHTIRGTEVHDLLNEWALHRPKPLHLVLISHINPPIPLASLIAKGMISEVRTQDLRFTPEETAAYLD